MKAWLGLTGVIVFLLLGCGGDAEKAGRKGSGQEAGKKGEPKDKPKGDGKQGAVVYTKWPFDAKEAKRRQQETARRLDVPVERTADLGGGVKLELVLIPAGEFMMGSKYKPAELRKRGPGGHMKWWWGEHPRHEVTITKPFYLGKHEVTQAQWQRVMGANPSAFKGGPKFPVEQVNWNDCQEFIKKLNARFKGKLAFRLPTEAEWECACRAGTDTPFHFGEKITTDLANYNGLSAWDGYKGKDRGKTTAAGSFKANPWGLHDMAGNVWEACAGWYGTYAKEAQTDPKGPEKGSCRVLRGGSWYDTPDRCRSASRALCVPDVPSDVLGLRVLVCVPNGFR